MEGYQLALGCLIGSCIPQGFPSASYNRKILGSPNKHSRAKLMLLLGMTVMGESFRCGRFSFPQVLALEPTSLPLSSRHIAHPLAGSSSNPCPSTGSLLFCCFCWPIWPHSWPHSQTGPWILTYWCLGQALDVRVSQNWVLTYLRGHCIRCTYLLEHFSYLYLTFEGTVFVL